MKKSFDKILMADVLFLCVLGVVMVYSASAYMAMDLYHDEYFFLKREMIFALLGLCGMFLAANFNYVHLRYFVFPFLGLCLFLMILVLIPGIGVKVGGAQRWLQVGGVKFQPSEMTKLGLILYMAHSLKKKEGKIKDFAYGFTPYVVILGVFFMLMLLQPDLGTAVSLAAVVMLMLFMAGTRLRYLFSLVLVSIPLLYVLIMGAAYRRRRFMAFLHPWKDAAGAGFQIIQSFLAIGSGGVIGTGLAQGHQERLFLPEPHTDFIFAIIGEELGFIGAVIVVAAFAIFLYRGMLIALRSVDPFGRYLALGLTGMVSIQALLNLSVVVGLLPTKGLTLPLLSYGGSSLLMTFIGVGILLNISKWTRER
ncbi:MAG: putative lipid II flippase FtsW [Deltaproteobacteria bacterium]|nr:putative lipid II flippase FtsW [Deltaproteobacteria bacterium]